MTTERTKYKLIKGETVGLNQPVYETQYRHDYYTNCFVCNRKVSTKVMYIDNDGSQRHFKCLSPERYEECK